MEIGYRKSKRRREVAKVQCGISSANDTDQETLFVAGTREQALVDRYCIMSPIMFN